MYEYAVHSSTRQYMKLHVPLYRYTGICTGMPTGVNYKFLVVSAAEKSFPQNKIVSAEVEYTTADLTSK